MTSEITSDPNAGPQLVIWGTDVSVSHCKEKFCRFVSKFVDKSVADDEQFEGMDINEPYYLQRLEEVKIALAFIRHRWWYQPRKFFQFSLHCCEKMKCTRKAKQLKLMSLHLMPTFWLTFAFKFWTWLCNLAIPSLAVSGYVPGTKDPPGAVVF